LASSFRHLFLGEAPLVALAATLLGGRWRGRKRQERRWRWQGSPRRGARGNARCWPRRLLRRPVALHQFHLACQADGRRECVRMVDADGVAERRKKTPGEELNALCLVKSTGAR